MQATDQSAGRNQARLRDDVMVLAVDDHVAFRDLLSELIAATPGFELVGEASSGEDAIEAVQRLSPQLVLMDVAMPGIGGIAAARRILDRHHATVIVLVSVDDPRFHPGVIALGDAVASLRKQDLRPQKLTELWESQRS